MTNKHTSKKAGFTLIELSIVLVIIGLIVGGVLIGQDLIKAAEIRGTITQIERFDSAVNTFRDKFGGLPGDIPNASDFPLDGEGASANLGNGDRLIQGTCTGCAAGVATNSAFGGESAMFWRHLSQADMIENDISAITNPNAYDAGASITALSDNHIPAADIAKGNKFHVTAQGGRNYYVLGNFASTTATGLLQTVVPAMTPIEARQIDEKKDDASPSRGTIISVDTSNASQFANPGRAVADAAAAVTNGCYHEAGTPGAPNDDVYATGDDGASNAPRCEIRIRASF